MSPEDTDAAFLWDMMSAAAEIQEFTHDVLFHEFADSKVLRYAVERQLIMLGEAAKRISEKTKNQFPEIPWSGIIGQRNVIAHEYGEVLTERIWFVAKEKIPDLIRLLEPIVPRPSQE